MTMLKKACYPGGASPGPSKFGLVPLFFLSVFFISCGPSRPLVLLDPALPVIDPREAALYSSFRVGLARGRVLEYPAEDPKDFLKETSDRRDPSAILLSPLLSTEYPSVREAFPEAWILGLELPEGNRTITASWDPEPACQDAGSRAGTFLRRYREGLPVTPESVIVSVEGAPEDDRAVTAFLAGLHTPPPASPPRLLQISPKPSVEEVDALTDELAAPGSRVLFLNAGWYGLKIARTLDSRLRGRGEGVRENASIFVVLRLPNRAAPKDAPADIVISGDTGGLIKAFRAALRTKQETALRVPESLAVRSEGKR